MSKSNDQPLENNSTKQKNLLERYIERYATGSYTSKRMRSAVAVTYSEFYLLQRIFQETLFLLQSETEKPNYDQTFKILDFGGAGGRFYEKYKSLQRKLLPEGKLNVVIYDIVAPDDAYLRLILKDREMNFSEEKLDTIDDTEDRVQKTSIFTSENGKVQFTFVKGPMINKETKSIDDITQQIRNVVENCDATYCGFGSLSHIELEANRNAILKTVSDITKGATAFVLPSRNVHKEDIKAYAKVREREPDLDLMEEGDAKYLDEDKNPNYYHHYSKEELERVFSVFPHSEVGNSSFFHPLTNLSNPEILDFADYLISETLNNIVVSDNTASYFQVSARSKELDELIQARQDNNNTITQAAKFTYNKIPSPLTCISSVTNLCNTEVIKTTSEESLMGSLDSVESKEGEGEEEGGKPGNITAITNSESLTSQTIERE